MVSNSSFMLGFSNDYLAEIGKVIVSWSHVEQQFALLFLSLVVMRGQSQGNLANPRVSKLMGAPFKVRIEGFRDRIRELKLSADKRNEVEEILDKLLILRTERDKLAHAVFSPFLEEPYFADDKASALYKSWKNQKPFNQETVRLSRITSIFDRIHTLFWELNRLQLEDEIRNANRSVGS